MAIKTSVRKDDTTLVIALEGKLDFETADKFRENLNRLTAEAGDRRVVFDFAELQFVGSSGISAFIHALREFNRSTPMRPRYSNVRNEFKRIITAFDETGTFEFWDSTERALKSFDQ